MTDHKAFYDYLASRPYDWDEKIVKSLKPLPRRVNHPRWWRIREEVRKLSEGIGYVKRVELEGWIGVVATGPWAPAVEHTHERVYQSHDWIRIPSSSDCVGEPCDPA